MADDGEFLGGGGDSFVEVSEKGWFSRIFDSFFAGIFGVVIFLGSFVVLYMNEGSVDESKLAKNAAEVNAAAPAGHAGQFVAATGPLVTDARLGDEYLKPGNYVSLKREAEMYAWREHKDERTEKKLGGGERKITEYSYDKGWETSPDSSSTFKKQAGHFNPAIKAQDQSWLADQAKLGVLAIDPKTISLPGGSKLSVADGQLRGGHAEGGYVYLADARPSSPKVGDTRLSYTALAPGGKYTVLGKLDGTTGLSGYVLKDDKGNEREFYRMFAGTKADALKQLSLEYSMWIWGFRLLGFLMCWGGMRMMMEPLNTLFDVLPFLGSMGRGLTGFVTFPIAVVLSGITIVVAWITHSLIAMVLIGLATLVGGVMLFGKRKAATA